MQRREFLYYASFGAATLALRLPDGALGFLARRGGRSGVLVDFNAGQIYTLQKMFEAHDRVLYRIKTWILGGAELVEHFMQNVDNYYRGRDYLVAADWGKVFARTPELRDSGH